jgi:hypothetical protein
MRYVLDPPTGFVERLFRWWLLLRTWPARRRWRRMERRLRAQGIELI